jgi:hypothetical protein
VASLRSIPVRHPCLHLLLLLLHLLLLHLLLLLRAGDW